jgi:circadian clock protein KaiB
VESYVFRIFVAGESLRSQRAVGNLLALCAATVGDAADIEVVDVLSEPERAEADRIMATPTVLRLSPDPVCRVIGDLSDFALAGAALGLTFAPRAVHGNDEEPDD